MLQGFEPVMLALAKDVTWYDERFRGPFGARTAQALDMSQHLTFEVNPLDFVVHIPFLEPEHVRAAADAVYDQVSACSGALGSPAGLLTIWLMHLRPAPCSCLHPWRRDLLGLCLDWVAHHSTAPT